MVNSRLKKHKSTLGEANALDNIGKAEGLQRKLKSALKNHNAALKIRLKFHKEDKENLCRSYYYIGLTQTIEGSYDEAYKTLNKALQFKLENTPKNTILFAKINQYIGNVYYLQRDYDNALLFFNKTLSLGKEVYKENDSFFSTTYNSLGLIYSAKEQFSESLTYYEKALDIAISNYGSGIHPSKIPLHFNIGQIYNFQNKKEKALFHTKKVLEMGVEFYGEDYGDLFYPYSQIGQIYGDKRGIPYIKKALEICKSDYGNDNFVRISFLYDYLMEIHMNIEDYSEALTYSKKALKIRSDLFGEYNSSTVSSYHILSKVYLALKDYKNALIHNEAAIKYNYTNQNDSCNLLAEDFNLTRHIDNDLLLETIKTKADILLTQYYNYQKKEDLQESIKYYEKATSLIELIRLKNRNYDDKIKFSEIVKSIYAKNIETSFLLNKQENNAISPDPFYFSEKSRANVLRELASNVDAKKRLNIDSDILELEQSIATAIADLQSEVVKETSGQKIDSIKLYQLKGKIFDLTRKKDSIEKKIELDFPEYYKLKYERKIIQLSELQEELDSKTTLLEFFKSDDVIYSFIITESSFNISELNIKDLDQKIQILNKNIVDRDQPNFIENSSNLYQELIVPIKKYFTGNKLIVIPDESLWYIPFDLLLSKKSNESATNKLSYLLEDYAISYANSASLLFEELEKTDLLDQCIAFSYTSIDSIQSNSSTISFTRLRDAEIDLPGTRKEIKEISKIFDGKYYYGKDASEINFKENVSKFKLVHLALHGDIDDINPKNLKIYFSNEISGKEDNQLFGHELYALNIPADLVVLSACNTGTGTVNNGEGILSLGNAFQYAGAKSLLLSRWEVSDKTTPKVMKYFYENLKKGMSKSEALQKAKLDFLKNADHFESAPFFWGGFYVLGNIEPISFDDSNTVNWVISFILLFLISVLLLTIQRKKSL